MFDDYDYKYTSKRISVRFVQEVDEPMYPWEIAGFLNKLNTVYYKYELLNSICSAINQGISPSEIFVFDKSLPLYEQYSEMNLLSDSQAAALFYPIGLPYPLVPNLEIYGFNLLYKAFREINSFLFSKHIKPLEIKNISAAYEVLQHSGLEKAESYIVELATERATRSAENARKKNKEIEKIGKDEIYRCLAKYKVRKAHLIGAVSYIESVDDDELGRIIKSKKRKDQQNASVLLSFFRHFDQTTRPLVCVRVGPGKFRVLGRSLVNKSEQTGLELKEAVRNSPLGALIEGGIAIYQATLQEKRMKELHLLDLEAKKRELQIVDERLEGERLRNLQLKLSIAKEIEQITLKSDIQAINNVENSLSKQLLLKAYDQENKNASSLLNDCGLILDEKSIRLINVKV